MSNSNTESTPRAAGSFCFRRHFAILERMLSQPHWKHVLYLICTSVLGALVAGLVTLLAVLDTSTLSFNLMAVVSLMALGAIAGIFVGRMWWHYVYVQDKRWHHIRLH